MDVLEIIFRDGSSQTFEDARGFDISAGCMAFLVTDGEGGRVDYLIPLDVIQMTIITEEA